MSAKSTKGKNKKKEITKGKNKKTESNKEKKIQGKPKKKSSTKKEIALLKSKLNKLQSELELVLAENTNSHFVDNMRQSILFQLSIPGSNFIIKTGVIPAMQGFKNVLSTLSFGEEADKPDPDLVLLTAISLEPTTISLTSFKNSPKIGNYYAVQGFATGTIIEWPASNGGGSVGFQIDGIFINNKLAANKQELLCAKLVEDMCSHALKISNIKNVSAVWVDVQSSQLNQKFSKTKTNKQFWSKLGFKHSKASWFYRPLH
jgi:hypothetical protein